ncbi:MAG TPA: hypothetical protein ENJ08_18240 [Gammaproteobacteria bacterium]|nr:hypothetical protein [Gammaproteobacteria bacterium]
MNKIKFILTGVMLFMPIISSSDTPEIGKYPSVYEGSDYVATILRLGKESEKTVLIKVDGVDNDFDGEIYLHTQKCDNTRCTNYKYETHEIPGKEKWWTIQVTAGGYGYENIIMYPPGIDKKTGIYKVKRPKAFDASKFYKEYLAQKSLRKK